MRNQHAAPSKSKLEMGRKWGLESWVPQRLKITLWGWAGREVFLHLYHYRFAFDPK